MAPIYLLSDTEPQWNRHWRLSALLSNASTRPSYYIECITVYCKKKKKKLLTDCGENFDWGGGMTKGQGV